MFVQTLAVLGFPAQYDWEKSFQRMVILKSMLGDSSFKYLSIFKVEAVFLVSYLLLVRFETIMEYDVKLQYEIQSVNLTTVHDP